MLGFEKGYSRCACERELETEQKLQYFDPKLMAVNVVSFSFSWCPTGGPGTTLLGDGFPYCILSATSLVPKLHRGSRGPPRPVWISLPHLVFDWNSNCNCHSNSTVWLLSWPSYIIVEPPLDLWNRMFNRHQAEITVIQFRGHSLPVRQSMRVSWDFLACPILLANFRPRDFLS